jgi:hypothetical protein
LVIANCNFTLAPLDGLEEQRNLSTIEKNFRRILGEHTRKLLDAKRAYWKNRARIKWAKLGDENTHKIHTVATKNYRRNLITHLKEPDDSLIFSHDHKTAIIWESYKNRLGISEATSMQFKLHDMIEAHDLHHLDSPFTPEEIEAVVKEMPPDKAPGPDGFNGHFLKKCWPTIKLEFIRLINDFYDEKLNLEAINTPLSLSFQKQVTLLL